jgi:hypothetical protein
VLAGCFEALVKIARNGLDMLAGLDYQPPPLTSFSFTNSSQIELASGGKDAICHG